MTSMETTRIYVTQFLYPQGNWRQRGSLFEQHINVQILQEFSTASQSSQRALCRELFRKYALQRRLSDRFRIILPHWFDSTGTSEENVKESLKRR